MDDTEFVALAAHIKGKLWTGDKQLAKGLNKLIWGKIITTEELLKEIKNKLNLQLKETKNQYIQNTSSLSTKP